MHSAPDVPAERIINNCSGKHVGFLAVAIHLEADPATYLEADGEVQLLVRSAIADMTDTGFDDLGLGTDGCSAPTVHVSLSGLATGLARVANPQALTAERAAACRRLTDAAALERWASTTVRNWDGHEVGHIELSPT